MLASRSVKPKLALSISTSTASAAGARPSLSLKSPSLMMSTPLRSPISPSPVSPTARNTRLNQRGYSTMQQPTYSYVNTSSSKSILKKQQQQHQQQRSASSSSSASAARRQLSFSDTPVVYCVTPIEDDDYYGAYSKMSKEERRWQRR